MNGIGSWTSKGLLLFGIRAAPRAAKRLVASSDGMAPIETRSERSRDRARTAHGVFHDISQYSRKADISSTQRLWPRLSLSVNIRTPLCVHSRLVCLPRESGASAAQHHHCACVPFWLPSDHLLQRFEHLVNDTELVICNYNAQVPELRWRDRQKMKQERPQGAATSNFCDGDTQMGQRF